jgi:multimeric flavodoxin WrbA
LKTLIIDACEDDRKYSGIEKLVNEKAGTDIEYFKIRDMDIHFCKGCWDCWVKTPGVCSQKDDHEKILRSYPSSDLVIFIAPIKAGYESYMLKKVKDRLIPLVHPYIRIYRGEQHHIQRYDKNPDIGLVLIKEKDTTSDEILVIRQTYERMILNIQCELKFVEVIDGIDSL